MSNVLDGLCRGCRDVVIAPHRSEFGAEPTEFIDEGLHLRRRPRARRVHPERAHHVARHAFPIMLGGAGAWIEEDETQDIALSRGS